MVRGDGPAAGSLFWRRAGWLAGCRVRKRIGEPSRTAGLGKDGRRGVVSVDRDREQPLGEGAGRGMSLYRRRRLGLAVACGIGGLVAVVAGWVGVSGTRLISDQLTYLASGCVLGLFLVGVAAILVVTDYMVEHDRRLDELTEVVGTLAAGLGGSGGAAAPDAPDGAGAGRIVMVEGATRAHRPSCQLVRGKAGVVSMDAEEAAESGLKPCRICQPELGRSEVRI